MVLYYQLLYEDDGATGSQSIPNLNDDMIPELNMARDIPVTQNEHPDDM